VGLEDTVVVRQSSSAAARIAVGQLGNLGASICEVDDVEAAPDLSTVDVVIADAPPVPGRPLPRAAFITVTAGGLAGLCTGQTELAVQAALGLVQYLGTPESPVLTDAHIASVTCAFHVTQAALAAMVSPHQPVVVEVSPARSLSTVKSIVWAARTKPDQWDGYHLSAQLRPPDHGYSVRDGRITLEFPQNAREGWVEFCNRLGLSFLVDELGAEWHGTVGVDGYAHPSSDHYRSALSSLGADEACEMARACGGWAFPFRSPEEAVDRPASGLATGADAPAWRISTLGTGAAPR
jgi:crotonobetainyl-CoA:carnitine CoA-transferase CaiB-like acyl-CoA transferase